MDPFCSTNDAHGSTFPPLLVGDEDDDLVVLLRTFVVVAATTGDGETIGFVRICDGLVGVTGAWLVPEVVPDVVFVVVTAVTCFCLMRFEDLVDGA